MSTSFTVKGHIAHRDLENALKDRNLWDRLRLIADTSYDTVEELADALAELKWDGIDRLPRRVKVEVTIDD